MVELGLPNSRMKDFFDVWFLARNFEFDAATLAGAIRATLVRRATALPSVPPTALTPAFGDDPSKQTQWRAFLAKTRPTDSPPSLRDVVEGLNDFLWPVLVMAAGGQQVIRWIPGSGWTK
jgi:hypothetical protein